MPSTDPLPGSEVPIDPMSYRGKVIVCLDIIGSQLQKLEQLARDEGDAAITADLHELKVILERLEESKGAPWSKRRG
jgi:hypothetical protein